MEINKATNIEIIKIIESELITITTTVTANIYILFNFFYTFILYIPTVATPFLISQSVI